MRITTYLLLASIYGCDGQQDLELYTCYSANITSVVDSDFKRNSFESLSKEIGLTDDDRFGFGCSHVVTCVNKEEDAVRLSFDKAYENAELGFCRAERVSGGTCDVTTRILNTYSRVRFDDINSEKREETCIILVDK